jgi:hypothetical protein
MQRRQSSSSRKSDNAPELQLLCSEGLRAVDVVMRFCVIQTCDFLLRHTAYIEGNAMSEDYVALSRQDLYELAWSKPMSDLARDFGISDVALAKRLRKLGVPVPGRGYWARVAAGQTPHRPALARQKGAESDEPAVHVPPPGRPGVMDDDQHANVESDAVCQRINALAVVATTDLRSATAAIKRTARRLKHPDSATFEFERGEKTGPVVDVSVSGQVYDRALLLADTFLRAARDLGWTFAAPAPEKVTADAGVKDASTSVRPAIGQLVVEGEPIGFRIEERMRDLPREPTARELAREKREYWFHAPRVNSVATGSLRLVRVEVEYGRRQSWHDRGSRRIEDKIPDILRSFLDLALELKARRAERERRRREHEESERKRRELETRRQVNAELIAQLETQAGAWYRARVLRAYVRALRRVGSFNVKAGGEPIDFLAWAERYVDAMDPLRSAPRAPELMPEEYNWRASEHAKEELSRLSGHDWAKSWKVAER